MKYYVYGGRLMRLNNTTVEMYQKEETFNCPAHSWTPAHWLSFVDLTRHGYLCTEEQVMLELL